jgi:hypothetical protein
LGWRASEWTYGGEEHGARDVELGIIYFDEVLRSGCVASEAESGLSPYSGRTVAFNRDFGY